MALKRIEGQVRGVHGMIERDCYCVDVLTQLAAVRGALRRVTSCLLESHLRGCVREALSEDQGTGPRDGQQHDHVEELLAIVRRFM